jgi:hypothetical protein
VFEKHVVKERAQKAGPKGSKIMGLLEVWMAAAERDRLITFVK